LIAAHWRASEEGQLQSNLRVFVTPKTPCLSAAGVTEYRGLWYNFRRLNKGEGMKRIMVIFAVAALAGCASVTKARVENGSLVVDSPFDLEIGSTEYAKMLGDYLESTTSARYDPRTKVTTTNWSWCATCKLSKPYFGCTKIQLEFKDEDRYLSGIRFDNANYMPSSMGSVPLDECRKTIREIASDMERTFEITLHTSNVSDDEIMENFERWDKEESKSNGKEGSHTIATSFCDMRGSRRVGGMDLSYGIGGMVGRDRMSYFNVHVSGSRSKEDPAVAKRRKVAHDEAARLRKTIANLFGVDLDAPEDEKKKDDSGDEDKPSLLSRKEWTKLEKPCEGMTERKVLPSNSVLGFTVAGLGLRRAYDGDVSEGELKTVAAEFLSRLEKAYGGKLPPADTEQGEKMLAKMYGEGVPAFGDSNAALQLERTNHFIGRVGDLAIEISYAVPQYAKKGDTFEIARRGGVLVNFVQTPILAEEKK